jgi:uncharacterized membrane protein (UPF0127 family)
MRIRNARNGRELSAKVEVADLIWQRMKGLLGRDRLDPGESLWIRPCRSIHTVGMRFPIDVVFLDKSNMVVAARERLQPNRFTRLYLKAVSVLELPEGTLAAADTRAGDRLEIS